MDDGVHQNYRIELGRKLFPLKSSVCTTALPYFRLKLPSRLSQVGRPVAAPTVNLRAPRRNRWKSARKAGKLPGAGGFEHLEKDPRESSRRSMNRAAHILLCLLMILTNVTTRLEAQSPPQEAFPLWPAGAVPLARGGDPVKDVPTLTPFWPAPEKATGAAFIVCPGGAYAFLAAHEGKDYAIWLSQRGIAAFVLKYRLSSDGYRFPAMLYDIQRAIRLVRFHAADWKLDPARVGVIGSSAGGHLSSTAMTHFDTGQADAADPIERCGSRPDLGVLCYPLITLSRLTHGDSLHNLLGDHFTPELARSLSNETQVTPQTPPCFIWHTADDAVVPVQNSLDFASALAANGVPFELHIYQHGSHGLGLGGDPAAVDASKLLPWTRELNAWLESHGFAK
jgi:acetyl esterase/lipase